MNRRSPDVPSASDRSRRPNARRAVNETRDAASGKLRWSRCRARVGTESGNLAAEHAEIAENYLRRSLRSLRAPQLDHFRKRRRATLQAGLAGGPEGPHYTEASAPRSLSQARSRVLDQQLMIRLAGIPASLAWAIAVSA